MRYIGLDVGGTKCAVSLGENHASSIKILKKVAFPTPGTWEDALDALIRAAKEMGEAQACGISCGGPLDARAGLIQSPPNLPGWDSVPVTRLVGEALSMPAFLENDANACALAEWRWGAGRGADDMVFLTFGTGLGAGLILGGRLVRGANGNAGECGHIRLDRFGPAGYGKAGSFEGFCSGCGLAQLGATLGRAAVQRGEPVLFDADNPTARSLADAARAGDPSAKEAFRLCGEKLGEGVSVLVDVLNPERIVIGSIFSRCEDLLRAPMEDVMRRECLRESLRAVSVRPAALGETLGDCAALSCAAYGLNRE